MTKDAKTNGTLTNGPTTNSPTTNSRAQKPMQAAQKDGRKAQPEWADGLRQLYDSVLNEPLPDSFAELLAKLDEDGP